MPCAALGRHRAMHGHAFLPMRCAGFLEPVQNGLFVEDVHLAEKAANLLGDGFALFLIDVENGDGRASLGKGFGCGPAKAGCAASDNERCGFADLHGVFLRFMFAEFVDPPFRDANA